MMMIIPIIIITSCYSQILVNVCCFKWAYSLTGKKSYTQIHGIHLTTKTVEHSCETGILSL
jgi:hypothetical protein